MMVEFIEHLIKGLRLKCADIEESLWLDSAGRAGSRYLLHPTVPAPLAAPNVRSGFDGLLDQGDF